MQTEPAQDSLVMPGRGVKGLETEMGASCWPILIGFSHQNILISLTDIHQMSLRGINLQNIVSKYQYFKYKLHNKLFT
jgi:hypothetical protein